MALVVLVGRPNVGKSTLFNRLATRKKAIVDDVPGVTRDCNKARGELYDLVFEVMDTPGLKENNAHPLQEKMVQHTEAAVRQADVILFVVDSKEGLTLYDREISQELKRFNKPIFLVMNKSESGSDIGSAFYRLGFGCMIALSAQHKLGFDDLYYAMRPHLGHLEVAPDIKGIQLAIIGRPNVGKSTIINKLLGEERLLTDDMAGVTRDTTYHNIVFEGQDWILVDTAGIRRSAKVKEKIEKLSVGEAKIGIQYAEITAIVLNANTLLDKQDLTIAQYIVNEGRALIFIVNMMDTVADKKFVHKTLNHQLETVFTQVKGVQVIYFSAIKDNITPKIFKAAQAVYNTWNTRIPTAKLNQWLKSAMAEHPLPIKGQQRLKIRYMTQIKTRPPTFILFSSRSIEVPSSYLRYLENGLRETFGLYSVPMRIVMRQQNNPYKK